MSQQRVVLEPAFVLHSIPYRTSSLIVDLLTWRYGRVSVLARSARGIKSRFQGKLQVLTPLLVSFGGRGELKNLNQLELQGKPYVLSGRYLMCAFYLNELLVRLLQKEDPNQTIYELYQQTLIQMEQEQSLEPLLRRFEKQILDILGYGLPLEAEAHTQQPIDPEQWYSYVPDIGFLLDNPVASETVLFKGASLIALNQGVWCDERQLQDAKKLLRQVLARHLGGKPLKSRDLMI